MAKTQYVKGDFKTCKSSANDFCSVARWCFEDKNGDIAGRLLSGKLYPFVVNASLACELYLKAILFFNSEKRVCPKTHDLLILFSHLKTFQKINFRKVFKDMRGKSLMLFLRENKTPFVSWRYAFQHEDLRIDCMDLYKLMLLLNEYVNLLK